MDAYYADTAHRNRHSLFLNEGGAAFCVRRDDKNRINIRDTGELLALTQSKRKIAAAHKIAFEVADYGILKKPYFCSVVFFNINWLINNSNKLGDYCKGKIIMALKEGATKLSCLF